MSYEQLAPDGGADVEFLRKNPPPTIFQIGSGYPFQNFKLLKPSDPKNLQITDEFDHIQTRQFRFFFFRQDLKYLRQTVLLYTGGESRDGIADDVKKREPCCSHSNGSEAQQMSHYKKAAAAI